MPEQTIEAFARAVEQGRLDRGLSKERAAREAGISSITWKRAEDALPIQDAKRRLIERFLDLDRGDDELDDDAGRSAAELADKMLSPDLADYTDAELLREIEGRLLRMAGELHADGRQALAVVVESDGTRTITSRRPT